MPDDQAELARQWIEDLRNAADEDGPPPHSETLASLDRGLADVAAGRLKSIAEYDHERGAVTYRLVIAQEAEKGIDRLDRPTARRIRARFDQLAEDPFDSS